MEKLTQEQLDEVIRLHQLWFCFKPGGVRADLSNKDLSGLNFSGANFYKANFRSVNFTDAICIGTNFTGANFTDAICIGANFTGANFTGAILWNCKGDGKRIRTTRTDGYIINHYDDRVQIGCKNHRLAEWTSFTDRRIASMGEGALGWWKQWREFVLTEGKGEDKNGSSNL